MLLFSRARWPAFVVAACIQSFPEAQASAFALASDHFECRSGPLARSYGAMPWLVYGCSDDKTIVMVSAPGNPARPFHFFLYQDKGRYIVLGEGTGRRELTGRALAELERLSDAEIRALLSEARQTAAGRDLPP